MNYQFQFQPYQRPFKTPLKTAHGIWNIREGIILNLTNKQGNIGWGEIAPLSWFGSETLEDAIAFCQKLPSIISTETIFTISDSLPACQFGFESALIELNSNPLVDLSKLQYSGLLPTGEIVLNTWKTLFQQGYQTLKWKIGVDEITTEINIFKQLVKIVIETLSSPQKIRLRLDANGGLTFEQAEYWLETCDLINANQDLIEIEFLEQPLSISQLDLMLELCDRYSTSLALDESVANLQQLNSCYQQGWLDIFVIKPAIFGSPRKLKNFCQKNKIDTVFSSVFETDIGQNSALKIASELLLYNRAVGFGINHWFIS
ncbi:o-succinylbenzoate synthase [Planktothrix agardhii]|jgi:O-succinylbenzoate synthase|uniref:o-succinylbenzoate synthase n=5 Tax=Planktothrix agardhii TaxID=1160 RepID=A0A073CXN4_PLAA1|nr:o-succinylbenzoate synthase [Planktothrix agardhii]AQY60532.1 MenC [Planktothrix agardhii No66]AQY60722.1 MenC [Planktothrix agardhii No365]AQY61104.1 O-succinylbenzoate synthase [Planktothrix agardhii NIVA-CYA 68]MCF3605619.1 o-succinylbenzoate synthase [Planktothrix agardhii 1033]BBD53479.1 O-succinylbenzoic acid synthase, MenC [Planktothrix agardhii NIES-204]